jgi:hypothetical protein
VQRLWRRDVRRGVDERRLPGVLGDASEVGMSVRPQPTTRTVGLSEDALITLARYRANVAEMFAAKKQKDIDAARAECRSDAASFINALIRDNPELDQ